MTQSPSINQYARSVRREYRNPRAGEVASFLSVHASWVKTYGHEIRFRPCPHCRSNNSSNPSTQINTESGLWRCWKCGTVGNWFTLTREFGDPLPIEDRYRPDPNAIDPDFLSRFLGQKRRPVSGGHYPDLLKYCHFRGISSATLNDWRVSTKGAQTLRWPIYAHINDKWQMVNGRMRVVLNRHKVSCGDWFEVKGGPTGLLLGSHLIDVRGPKRAIIFEGQWDAMTAYEIGLRNVFSLPNGAEHVRVGEMLRYVPEDWEIWLSMDMDEAGQRAVEKFFAQLGPEKVARLKLPYKDLNAWLMAHRSLTSKEVEETAEGLTTLTALNGKLSRDNFMIFSMDDDDEDKNSQLVIETPWTGLNRLLAGGLRGGETTGLLAPSGKGKTTACNQIATHAASHGTTVGMISLEGTRTAYKRKLRDIIRGTVDAKDYQTIVDKMLISPLEGPRVTVQQCLDEFDSMIRSGARLLVWDNPDFITRDNHRDKIDGYAGCVDLARKNDVHVIVVWQPNKVDSDQIVNSGNQKGYSQTYQDADNYINMNRINDFIRLEIEKTREKGVNGNRHVWMTYDQSSRRFDECAEDIATSSRRCGNVINLTDRR